jgi:hypothetical protein
MTLLRTHR